jgi:SAM-dependent methyltransferase
MSDESDKDDAISTPPAPRAAEVPEPAPPPVEVPEPAPSVVDFETPAISPGDLVELVELAEEGRPVRSGPPPKPRSLPAMPAVRPASVPAPHLTPPPTTARSPHAHPVGTDEPAASIKPLRMIKLGDDGPRSQPPPAELDRRSSRPPASFDAGPPLRDEPAPALPLPPALPPAPRMSFDPPTAPRVNFDPPTEPRMNFDPPTQPIADLGAVTVPDDDDEPLTPPRAAAPAQVAATPALRSAPPPAPSARARLDSAEDVEALSGSEIESVTAEETHPTEVEAAPASEEEPISVSEGEPISMDIGALQDDTGTPAADDSSRDTDKAGARKPPPPPKRSKGPASSPSDALALETPEPPKFDPQAKPRVKPWWEELFTDDFGRGILPPTEPQVKREVNFIEDSLAVAKGGIVLDLACGNGHHAVELAGRGYGVVGFDLSLPQLAVAGEYAQDKGQKINFLQGDMREMSFEEVFDGIYCWNTSFGYFEEERNFAVAQRVFKALRPGGSFLLDVVNRDFVVEHQPSQVWFEGDSCVCMDDMNVDFITSRLRVKRTMMLDDGRTRECSFSIRIYSLHELGKLLHDIGFRVTEASGHPAYPGRFFGATSPRVLILAQKP